MVLTNFLQRFRILVLLAFFAGPVLSQNQAAADSLFAGFMKRWNISGGSIAVSRQGQFIYQRGIGYADVHRSELVQTDTRFRLASLSKCFTASAIMKLVEQGRLSLNQKVFGKDRLVDAAFYSEVISNPLIYDITVRNLLEHTAGWDRKNRSLREGAGDPPFHPLYITKSEHLPNPVTDSALIRYSLRRGPDNSPGTAFAYSNVGYLILGKIIEKVSGESYADFVQHELFAPLGLNDFELGHTALAERLPRESYYFSEDRGLSCNGDNKLVSCAYGAYHVEAMNAHGGWIGSAEELCRYLNNLTGYDGRYPILQTATVQEMIQAGTAYPNYAKGWFVNAKGTFWHTGSLDGSSTFMGTTKNGYTWAFLFNGRGDNSSQFWKELDALPWQLNKLIQEADTQSKAF